MQQQQQHFGYQPPQKQLKLLALALALTAVATIFMGFQVGERPLEFDLITIKPPYSRPFLWGAGLLIGILGGSAWKNARAIQGKRFELAILEDTVVMREPANIGSESELFQLSNVDWFRVVESKTGRRLVVKLLSGRSSTGLNSTAFASEDMDSREEFDVFVTRLREKLGPDKERG